LDLHGEQSFGRRFSCAGHSLHHHYYESPERFSINVEGFFEGEKTQLSLHDFKFPTAGIAEKIPHLFVLSVYK